MHDWGQVTIHSGSGGAGYEPIYMNPTTSPFHYLRNIHLSLLHSYTSHILSFTLFSWIGSDLSSIFSLNNQLAPNHGSISRFSSCSQRLQVGLDDVLKRNQRQAVYDIQDNTCHQSSNKEGQLGSSTIHFTGCRRSCGCCKDRIQDMVEDNPCGETSCLRGMGC